MEGGGVVALEHESVDNEDQHTEIEMPEVEEEEEGGEHDQSPKGAHLPVTLSLAGRYREEKRADFLFHFEGGRRG